MKKGKKRKHPEGRNQNQVNNNITMETRQESYIRRPIRRDEILGILGDSEMTARQIMIASPYHDMNSIRPRLTEMKNDGLIEAVGKAYDIATKRQVAIFRAVPFQE